MESKLPLHHQMIPKVAGRILTYNQWFFLKSITIRNFGGLTSGENPPKISAYKVVAIGV